MNHGDHRRTELLLPHETATKTASNRGRTCNNKLHWTLTKTCHPNSAFANRTCKNKHDRDSMEQSLFCPISHLSLATPPHPPRPLRPTGNWQEGGHQSGHHPTNSWHKFSLFEACSISRSTCCEKQNPAKRVEKERARQGGGEEGRGGNKEEGWGSNGLEEYFGMLLGRWTGSCWHDIHFDPIITEYEVFSQLFDQARPVLFENIDNKGAILCHLYVQGK